MIRIKLRSIEARLIDARTNEEDKYLIAGWIVNYDLVMKQDAPGDHVISGSMFWGKAPDPELIMEYLRIAFNGAANIS